MRVTVAALLTAMSAASLEGQDAARIFQDSGFVGTERPYRDPQLAQVLGIILPGAGHIYAGEYWRGYLGWVTTIGGIGMGAIVYNVDRCTFNFLSGTQCDPGPRWPNRLLGAFMVGAGVWTWISTARDAPHAAERANARHGSRRLKLAPLVEPAFAPHPTLRLGVGVRW